MHGASVLGQAPPASWRVGLPRTPRQFRRQPPEEAEINPDLGLCGSRPPTGAVAEGLAALVQDRRLPRIR